MFLLVVLINILLCHGAQKCMNFYGLETDRSGLVCDWAHDPSFYLKTLKDAMDINTIRLPFSYQYIKWDDLTLLDRFVDSCKQFDMDVILDYHRTWKSHQGPQPEEGITREEFVTAWKFIANRFRDRPHVKGIGVFNEYQGSNWTYLIDMHNAVISSIESDHPGRYNYYVGCAQWGGDCSGMKLKNYNLTNTSRLFVEVHKYIFSGVSVENDWDKSMPSSIPPDNWVVGEVGWKNGDRAHRDWAEKFVAYLIKRNISNVCAWTIAHSGDTEGWWNDDCETFDWNKAALFKSIWTENLKRLRDSNFLRGSYILD